VESAVVGKNRNLSAGPIFVLIPKSQSGFGLAKGESIKVYHKEILIIFVANFRNQKSALIFLVSYPSFSLP